MNTPIYMDAHATTPMDPQVVEAMLPYFTQSFGNAASRTHSFGHDAEAAVDSARTTLAELIGARPKEIIFTSGATESDNLAIKGAAEFHREMGNHIITSVIEHHAVLDSCKALERAGFEVTYLPVDKYGAVNPSSVEKAITPQTVLVSIMLANNEIGTISDLVAIGKITRQAGVLFHSDATQGVGRVGVNVDEMNLDLMSFSAHKMYGPKGVGALYVRSRRPRVRIRPQMDGGGHERGMRSGTLNVPSIVGFAKAAEICMSEMDQDEARIDTLKERLYQGITSKIDSVFLNGHPTNRLAGNLNLSFAYVEGESLLMGLKDVAISSGSACTSSTLEPSYVLKAIGVEEDLAHTSLRFGLHRFTTEEEVDFVIADVIDQVSRLREMSPLYEMAQAGVDMSTIEWPEDH